MSAPFGGHPTLGQYIEWVQSLGFRVESGYSRHHGEMHYLTRIISQDKSKWVIEVDTQQDEYLAPSTVGRFDRRLGLRSPFPAMHVPEE